MASKSANATEAPTSGATAENLEKRLTNATLTAEEMDFVQLVDQVYSIEGRVLTIEDAINLYQFDHNEYVKLIRSDLVRAALDERGITVRASVYANLELVDEPDTVVIPEAVGADATNHETLNQPEWREKALSPLQLIAVNTMLDLIDQRSEKKKLQDLGVSTSQWQRWLKDTTFNSYLRERAEAMLGDHRHDANLALLDKIRMGDLKAIEYYNEMMGIYVRQTQSNTGSTSLTDFKQMLIRIMEIITDEVHDPQVAEAISERLRALITMNGIANQLVEPEVIVQPQIAKARELTPQLQELMEHGAGQ